MKYCLVLPLMMVVSVLSAQSDIPSLQGFNQQQQNGHYIFTPKALLKTGFVYEIMPPEAGGDANLQTWLQNRARKEIQDAGYTFNEGNPRLVQSYETYTASITDKNNRKWLVNFVAFRRSDSATRYASILMPAGYKSPYLNTALKHFIQLSTKEGVTLPAAGASRRSGSDTYGSSGSGATGRGSRTSGTGRNSSGSDASRTRSKKVETPLTAAGMGIKPAAIKGVVLNTEYGVGVGGAMITELNPYLLLNDGTVYRYITCAPYDLDVAQSKQVEPNRWGTWKLSGKNMMMTFTEKKGIETDTMTHWYWSVPAKKGEKINGGFSTISGGGNTALGGTSMVFSSSNLKMNEKGQFTYEHTGGGSSADAGVSVSAYSSDNKAGTYILDGYAIELRFNNGQVQRKLLYFYPDSHTTFGMGGSTYISDKR